jgi:subtilisin family serine protease
MAGPHVVGVVALMWSANPELIGDIERTTQILNQSAAPFTGQLPSCVSAGDPNNAAGYGVLDAFTAVQLALKK